MNKQDFYFDLPPELIAQYPLENRSDSRLLTYNRQKGEYGHYQFREIADFLNPGDLLVMNDSKVIPARLYGHKTTGGKVELLVERITGEFTFLAHIKASKALKPGSIIKLEQNKEIEILDRKDDLFICKAAMDVLQLLNGIGHIPLPPTLSEMMKFWIRIVIKQSMQNMKALLQHLRLACILMNLYYPAYIQEELL